MYNGLLILHLQFIFKQNLYYNIVVEVATNYSTHSVTPSTTETTGFPPSRNLQCPVFSSDVARPTKFKMPIDLPAGQVTIKLWGSGLSCDHSLGSERLYMMGIPMESLGKWAGKYKKCNLVSAGPKTSTKQICQYKCVSSQPLAGIQIAVQTSSADYPSWKLCFMFLEW